MEKGGGIKDDINSFLIDMENRGAHVLALFGGPGMLALGQEVQNPFLVKMGIAAIAFGITVLTHDALTPGGMIERADLLEESVDESSEEFNIEEM